MFGKKKAFSSARIGTLIGQGAVINGDLVFSGGLHVDGNINGNVIAEEGSNAILILSESGRIEGEVKVPNMVLNGEIVGDVYGAIRVELAPDGLQPQKVLEDKSIQSDSVSDGKVAAES